MDEDFYRKLGKSINYIIVNQQLLSGGTFDVRNIIHKYSSLKEKSNKLYYNNQEIKTKGTYVNYQCEYCKKNITILLVKYLHKNNLICMSCKEKDKNKRLNQSNYMIKTYSDYNKVVPKKIELKKRLNNKELIDISNKEFENEDESFKNYYYSKHLNIIEFLNIKNNIYSVNGYKNIEGLLYYEHIKTNNQMKYSSYLYDNDNDFFINFNKIEYICENCDEIFKTSRKPVERLKNKKCLCKRCSFSNKTFKVKHTFNCIGDKILYQSKPELELINYCNNINVIIKNGPKLDYIFKNKKQRYFIDYYIPSHKLLIEIKDHHIWHKNQVDSGKWFLKEQVAKKFAKENGLIYKIIFIKELSNFYKEISN